MNKSEIVNRKGTRTYHRNPRNNAVFARFRAENRDVSEWIYAFDNEGNYRGCANEFTNGGKELEEISEKEFLSSTLIFSK